MKRPNTLSIPLASMPNVNFLELAAGMRQMYGIETVYYYFTDSRFRVSRDIAKWLREFADKNESLPVFEGPANDAKAKKCLSWVRTTIKYVGDIQAWKTLEYWQTVEETLKLLTGDCEDGAILLYCVMRKNGFTDDQMFLTCGNVVGGGHCYLVYVSNEDAVHYVLDWCYWPRDSLKIKYGENPNYFFGEKEWFRFNSTSAYVRR